MKINVVTNCSKRKAISPAPQLCSRTLRIGTYAEVSREWGRRIRAADCKILAKDLYQGRGFKEARIAANLARTPLQIISAGLGLVSESDEIPPYSLTVADGDVDSISRKLVSREHFVLGKWWKALQAVGLRRRVLATDISESKDTLFILALSPMYLGLVLDDLMDLDHASLMRVRIVGPRRQDDVPEGLRPVFIPYDNRIDGLSSPIKGTESDFPQRAARHFVEVLLKNPQTDSPENHLKLVSQAMKGWAPRTIPHRTRLSDAGLRKAIRHLLRKANGSWTRALRMLRDDMEIACEEKRFRSICREILGIKD